MGSIGSTTVMGSGFNLPFSTQGTTIFTYFATDNADNGNAPKTLTVKLDATVLNVTATASPATSKPNNKLVNVTVSGTGIGVDVARNFKRQGIDIDVDLLVKGLKDVFSGQPLLMTEKDLRKTLGD